MVLFRFLTLLTLATQILALPVAHELVDKRDDLVPGGGLKLDFTVSHSITKGNATDSSARRKRGITTAELNHNTFYTVNLAFGSQQTTVGVDLDTGSADLWVPGAGVDCTLCTSFGTFDVTQSSSAVDQYQQFSIEYVDHTTSQGEFYQDQLGISGVTVNNAIFAVVSQTSVDVGILGVGFEAQEAEVFQTGYQYTNFPATLAQQGLISKNFYSLYLDSPAAASGSIIFGGTDPTKYKAPLVTLSNPSSVDQAVTLTSVTGSDLSSLVNYQVVLDSGTTFTYLEEQNVQAIASLFPGSSLNDAGYYTVSCTAPAGNLNFNFGNAQISIPLSGLIGRQFDATGHYVDGCALLIGIGGFNQGQIPPILGDNFLRWAYVVYDLADQQISIAQSVFT